MFISCQQSLLEKNKKKKYKHKGKIYLTRKTVRELKQLKVSVTNFQ